MVRADEPDHDHRDDEKNAPSGGGSRANL